MHIHIDPVGGIAGDMFVAAMLDLYPNLEEGMLASLNSIDALKPVTLKVARHSDSVLTGKRLVVDAGFEHHQHARFSALFDCISASRFSVQVKAKALDILENLAQAEAAVHGVALEDVTLHEAGSLDSLADIVCSAYLIDAVGDASWSCGSLPAGNGTVNTAHGELPLPAPAVVELLKGCPVHNDGREGERVTPTGAALLRSLAPQYDKQRKPMTLVGVGHGFGTRDLPGLSNIVRLSAYEPLSEVAQFGKIAILTFEVDDQSLEDLSIGLEHLRMTRGVLDVIQIPATGKKGRLAVHVQVLTETQWVDDVAAMCLSETATLGVRVQIVDRMTVPRSLHTYEEDGEAVPLKLARRPDGTSTAKVEADYLQDKRHYGLRKNRKQKIEAELENDPPKQ